LESTRLIKQAAPTARLDRRLPTPVGAKQPDDPRLQSTPSPPAASPLQLLLFHNFDSTYFQVHSFENLV